MRQLNCILPFIVISLLTCVGVFAKTPVNPHASDEAREVLVFLYSLQDKQMLTGQHVIYGAATERELNYIEQHTGKLPKVYEFEGGIFEEKFSTEYMEKQAGLITDAHEAYQNGALIAICWHWANPLEADNTYEGTKRAFDIEAALREGTDEHAAMMRDLDVTADMLEELQKLGVPVLWRPLHEMCGGWFWWSKQGRDTAIRLWDYIYDYYTYERKLNNLLWVYSASQKVRIDWVPSLDRVDVVGVDIYLEGEQGNREHYDKLASVAGGKPIALTECDVIPHPDLMLEQGFLWSWFLPWHTQWLRKNEPEYLREVYHHPQVLTQ